MGIFNWWHGSREQLDAAKVSKALIAEATDLVVKIADPRLVVVRHYRERLAEPVERMIAHLRSNAAVLLPEREASPAAWATDPVLRAFFARPDDLVHAFSQSSELREFFDAVRGRHEAHAVLGMEFQEQKVLGTRLRGDIVEHDVMQKVLRFSDYRVRIVAPTEADLRHEIGRRVFEQMALKVLELAESTKGHAQELETQHSLLKLREKLLMQGAAGMRPMLGNTPRPREEELHRIEAMLEENERELKALPNGAGALERKLELLLDILSHARESFSIGTRKLRLDAMNVVAEGDAAENCHDVEFNVFDLAGTPPLHRAGALVRVGRTDLLSRESQLREAEKALG
jgi:hypothetical protein